MYEMIFSKEAFTDALLISWTLVEAPTRVERLVIVQLR
jgi:hypothetical protein